MSDKDTRVNGSKNWYKIGIDHTTGVPAEHTDTSNDWCDSSKFQRPDGPLECVDVPNDWYKDGNYGDIS